MATGVSALRFWARCSRWSRFRAAFSALRTSRCRLSTAVLPFLAISISRSGVRAESLPARLRWGLAPARRPADLSTCRPVDLSTGRPIRVRDSTCCAGEARAPRVEAEPAAAVRGAGYHSTAAGKAIATGTVPPSGSQCAFALRSASSQSRAGVAVCSPAALEPVRGSPSLLCAQNSADSLSWRCRSWRPSWESC